MWRFWLPTMACAAILGLLPADGLAQKKKNDKNKESSASRATQQEYGVLARMKEITGKLVYFDSGSNNIVISVETSHAEPNGKGNNNQALQQARRAQQQANRQRNPLQRQQAMARAAQQAQMAQMKAQNNVKIVTTGKEFELVMSDKIVLRKMTLATEFDDTGNIKKYTAKELAALRGKDSSLPGYEAKPNEILPGAYVTLRLTPPKSATKTAEDGVVEAAKPTVRMLIITQHAEQGIGASKGGARPKKK